MASTAAGAGKAITRGYGLPGGRLYDAADLLCWVAGLNLLVLAFSLAGGIVLGLAPALVAGAAVCRGRARGDAEPLVRTFARTWRAEFVRANALLAPFGVLVALLAANLYAFSPEGGPLVVVLWAALALTGLTAAFAITMYTHYELPLRRYALMALRYLLHDLPTTALVAVVTVLAVLVTRFVPGLLPVIAIGAWLYLVSALCLSSYARNDHLVAASAGDE